MSTTRGMTGFFLSFLLLMQSCSDDIVTGVFSPEKDVTEKEKSSLTVTVENVEQSEGLLIALFEDNIFDESGNVSDISETDLLLSKELNFTPPHQVVFEDISDYYKKSLYVNVLRKKDNHFDVLTHSGNQIEYFVIAGEVKKTIDCAMKAPDMIRKTKINVMLPDEYVGKEIYFLQDEKVKAFLEVVNAGNTPEKDMYLYKKMTDSDNVSFEIITPLSPQKYVLVLLKPEPGLGYLRHSIDEIDYDKPSVNFTFPKEVKKRINITAARIMEEGREEPLNNHEIYLIEKSKWPTVESVVKEQHGHPESGMYVEKSSVIDGTAVFELFCTEHSAEYVVYIPKWNTEYYDSFQTETVTLTPEIREYTIEFKYPYLPPSGGGDITKSVNVSVTLQDFEGYNFGWGGAFVYVLNDSEKLGEAINSISSGMPYEGIYISKESVNDVSELPRSIILQNVEINTGKEIAVFIYPVMKGFPPKLAVKRIPGANITNPYNVTLTDKEIENIPY